MAWRFRLNGHEAEVAAEPAFRTLLDWLRARGLPGTKEGCAEGDCGACTVVVLDPDGLDAAGQPAIRARATNACLVPLGAVAGRSVWTVEGLGTPQHLHPAQRAMVDRLGSQCGYCTPGFVMALAEACHRDDLRASWQLDDQLAGNLCRCTGYRPIRDALADVVGTHPEDGIRRDLHSGGGTVDRGEERGPVLLPESLDELLSLRAAHPAVPIVAGATDLGLSITQQHARPPLLLSVERVRELRRFEAQAGGLRIGAAVRLADLELYAERALPPVARMLRYFGARAIKQRATVGGNLVNASPIGDLAPVLLALDASVDLRSVGGTRRVPLRAFFTGYRTTALRPDEVLEAVFVPTLDPAARATAFKVSRRRELDISAVAFGACVRLDDRGRVMEARLGFGGLAATPARAPRAEAALLGQPWTVAGTEEARGALDQDFTPIDDLRGAAAFRRTLARNLLLGFVLETTEPGTRMLPAAHTGTVVLEEGAHA